MIRLMELAWRNVWRNQRRTLIAVVAIALGLALILLLDGLIAGSKHVVFGNAIKLQGGNVFIHASGYGARAKRMPLLPLPDADAAVEAATSANVPGAEVVSASRRIATSGMVSSREGTFPVVIYGIEPEAEPHAGLVAQNVAIGRYLEAADGDEILIGRGLADRLDTTVGERITMSGKATHEQMRSRTMTVIGVYDLGMPDIEKSMVFVSLAEAQSLTDLRGSATAVAVMLSEVGAEDLVVNAIRTQIPGYEVESWESLNPEMKQTIEANELFNSIFGLVVLLIAGVGILNLLLMAVFERTREIGLLAAMGLKTREIMWLFLWEGTLMGILGALAGTALGWGVVAYLGMVGLDWSAGDYSDLTALIGGRVYPRLTTELLVARTMTVGVIAALASVYPAWRASRREPAEALHYV